MSMASVSSSSLLNDVQSLRKRGKSTEAERLLRDALKTQNDRPEIWAALGAVMLDLAKTIEANKALAQSLKLKFEQPDVQFYYARTCRDLNDYGAAITHFNHVIKQQPDYLDAYLEMTDCLMAQQQHDMALKVIDVANKVSPDHPAILAAKATVLREMGQMEEAAFTCREGLYKYRENATLFCILSGIEKLESGHPLTVQARLLLDADRVQGDDRFNLAFALAGIFAREKDYATAFRYYQEGNKLRAEQTPYDADAVEAEFAAIKVAFPEDSAIGNHAPSSPTPVFILGMPRSGTTLVEQILSSHPQVFGGGEMPHIRVLAEANTFKYTETLFPESIALLDQQPDRYKAMAGIYLEELRKTANGEAFVCDKMPHNFLYVGFIRKLFPDAKIIHCRRQPVDTCFSIFSGSFAGHHPYAYTLESVGQYYRLYDNLMQHWETIFPGWMHTVQYEAVVDDLKPQVEALLAYCELPWHEDCLRFYESERVVQTMSVNQVRRPIYRSSVDKWKPYAEQLAPLKELVGSL